MRLYESFLEGILNLYVLVSTIYLSICLSFYFSISPAAGDLLSGSSSSNYLVDKPYLDKVSGGFHCHVVGVVVVVDVVDVVDVLILLMLLVLLMMLLLLVC